MELPYNWIGIDDPKFGFMNTISQSIRRIELRNPGFLPNLRNGEIIFAGSDYSGQHKKSIYETISFLVTNLDRCGAWERDRRAIREEFLRDGRRMAFKNLNDVHRRNALIPFLSAANRIPGICVTVAIHKNVGNLFWDGDFEAGLIPLVEPMRTWHSGSIERMLRVVNFVSLVVAGLSRPAQDVYWFSDEDEFAANSERIIQLTEIFAHVLSHYLPHDFNHMMCGSTASDNGTRELEDLVSVPDLVAGALAEIITMEHLAGNLRIPELITPMQRKLSPKSRIIGVWCASNSYPLKRLIFLINKGEKPSKIDVKTMNLHVYPL